MSMRFETLAEWLNWQETLHPSLIDLGLERVDTVFQRLYTDSLPPFTVVTVAGTNGKGSSVAMLQAVLLAAGYRVGSYTSPHLLRYNERICINGEQATDEAIIASFQRIDAARQEISLTYFEFGTLAALDIFYQIPLDVVLLEVGLGGRLDAVNIIDADVALITSIGLDHTNWLGSDREAIAREKAGIMRTGKPVVCSDPNIPQAVVQQAEERSAPLYCLGQDFDYQASSTQWNWHCRDKRNIALPLPVMRGNHQMNNAAGVLMVLELLADRFPVTQQQLRQGLLSMVPPPGRQQITTGTVTRILDVAHNEDSVGALAEFLAVQPCQGKTRAVVGMLADKDIPAILGRIANHVDSWYLGDIRQARGARADDLRVALEQLRKDCDATCYPDIKSACEAAEEHLEATDRLVVFGSFYTVAEVLTQGV